MGLLIVLVIPQVEPVHVLIMLVEINAIRVQLDGMVSQVVKVIKKLVINIYFVQ